MTFATINMFSVYVAGANSPSLPPCTIQIYTAAAVMIYNANYALPANQQWHVLVSVNCTTRVVQVYVNDVPLTPVSGGWTGTGNMPGQLSTTSLNIGSGLTSFPGVANIWEATTPTWIDLSVVANRRKFINADLSPVDLGPNGGTPFGTNPPIYLIAKTGPNDFATNYGTGGSLGIQGGVTLTMQAPGTCPCASS
jgi:hypothetical protein